MNIGNRIYGSRNTPEFWANSITNELAAYFNNYGSEYGFKLICAKIASLDTFEEDDKIAQLVFAKYAKDLRNHKDINTYEDSVREGKKHNFRTI